MPRLAVSWCIEPIHANLRGSYLAFLLPNSGSSAVDAANTPMIEPSFGAALYRKFAAFIEPAPVMFWTTTVGLPGICFDMCAAIRRVILS